jgi:hypothetical protein
MIEMKKHDKQAQRDFLKAAHQYPRSFDYKNIVGVTLYRQKEHNLVNGEAPKTILNHVECGDSFDFDAQDYGYKEARIWITSRIDPHRLGQSIGNLDFDLVEISRKDFDDYHGLMLTRRQIFSDDPVENGFLGEWCNRWVNDEYRPRMLSVDDIKHIIDNIHDKTPCDCQKCTQEGSLERGWYLAYGGGDFNHEIFVNGWRQ